METELRLGLPGGGVGGDQAVVNTMMIRKSRGGGSSSPPGLEILDPPLRKRGFSETESEITTEDVDESSGCVDLKLNLSSNDAEKSKNKEKKNVDLAADPAKPQPKAQVVGWPPVRSFRKNILSAQKSKNSPNSDESKAAALVKVSMDGAPYLRKVDLSMYKTYPQLSDALAKMFSSFTIGNCGSQAGTIDFMNERKLMDLLNDFDYIPTYEDKDGDWMLVGDVTWEMFVESCKRLRIMKGKEAVGLAPRAMEKCKNKS